MAYTLILMRRDRTDRKPVTVHLTYTRFWVLLVLLVGLPVAAFMVSYYLVAPAKLGADISQMQADRAEALATLAPLEEENDELKARVTQLQKTLQTERQQRAEAEARITIAETARYEGASRVGDMEEELISLRQSLKFYEELVRPKTERDLLKCFNISAEMKGKKLTYGINFLKNDTDNKDKIQVNVQMRILQGNAEMKTPETSEVEPIQSRSLGFTNSYRLTGSFTYEPTGGGLRILDVRGLDEENRVIAHCWKAL